MKLAFQITSCKAHMQEDSPYRELANFCIIHTDDFSFFARTKTQTWNEVDDEKNEARPSK